MLEVSKIRNQKTIIIENLKKRGINIDKELNDLLSYDQERISNQQIMDDLLAEGNKIAQEIGIRAKNNQLNEITPLKERASIIKTEAKSLAEKGKLIEDKIMKILINIPNVPNEKVPIGKTAKDNAIELEWGESIEKDDLKPHWDLAEKYQIIDFKKGAQITGSGFPLYKGRGAQLQRGLINFFLDFNIAANYEEYRPPYFVNEESAFNTGQIPDKEGMMYHMENDNLYAIPTAEVPITNIFRNTKLLADDLPIKCTAYSPCFRREAGSYGKEVRGLNRLHQFDKVEIVQICQPSNSYKALDEMVDHVSILLKKLNLKFRIVKLCGGDLGHTSALTYDFEVYAEAQKKWLEVSSVSNFETYQSNRLNLKFVDNNKKNVLCHTLNGSALALPRIMAAIIENNQTKDGILIPKALRQYVPFNKITNI